MKFQAGLVAELVYPSNFTIGFQFVEAWQSGCSKVNVTVHDRGGGTDHAQFFLGAFRRKAPFQFQLICIFRGKPLFMSIETPTLGTLVVSGPITIGFVRGGKLFRIDWFQQGLMGNQRFEGVKGLPHRPRHATKQDDSIIGIVESE